MDTTKQYRYVPLDESNIHLLIELYQKVFGVSYSLSQIKQKYQPTYTGLNAQGHFAFYKDQAVAFHGAIPVQMRYKNQIELCAQYGDAMTLKAHTGNGLFTRLGELTDSLLKENGVRFVWGFPNQNSEYGYIHKLNWQGNKRMQCYVLPLGKLSQEVIFRKTLLFNKRYQEKIEKKLAPLLLPRKNLHSIDPQKAGGINRSEAFYAYKSFSKNYFIHLEGTKIWIKPLGGLLVGDLELTDEKQLLNCIKHLKILAKELGLNKVVIQTSPESELNLLLKQHYTPIDSWLIGFKNFDSDIPFDQLQFTYGDLDTF